MKKQFYVQLDGLRALAVIGVMISHWIFLDYIKVLGFGFWGVNLFFVLSGFLISEILLKQINRDERPAQILKSFYIKRTLRIFPIYYLYMLLLSVFDIGNAREVLPYSLTYTLNFQNAITGNINEAPQYLLGHIWSLCVEEQFYLVWPFLLLLFKPKYHLRLIIITVLTAVTFRFCFYAFQVHNYSIYNYRMMPACMDALGLGALLAYLKNYKAGVLNKILRLAIIPVICLACYLTFVYIQSPVLDASEEVLSRFFVCVCSFFLIGRAVYEYKNWFGKFLKLRFIQYLGKISYGLYLYHLAVSKLLEPFIEPYIVTNVKPVLPVILKNNLYILTAPVYFLSTVLVASVSFYLIEKPFLKMKDGIDYKWIPKLKTM